MRWRASAVIPATLLLLWFTATMALGPSSSGVELNSNRTGPEPPQPLCERVHTYYSRGWGGHDLIRSDVWLTSCVDSGGNMRADSGPTCSATSFLGSGAASCTEAPDGRDLKVTVNLHYPFWLEWISGVPPTTTFRIDPGGGYNSP